MPTLTLHETILYVIVGILFTFGGYLMYRVQKTTSLSTLLNPLDNQQNNNVKGDISNLAARDIVHHHGNNELLYFAQCKDLQNTVDKLLKQLQQKSKLLTQVLTQNDQLTKDNKSLQRKVKRLEAAQRFPLLPIGTWKKEEKEEQV